MRFYDREAELRLFEDLGDSRPSFVVLTGRRRVGKTALIRRFIEGRRAVYLFVDDKKGAGALLSEFEGQLREQLGLPEYVHFDDFEGLVRYLMKEGGDVIVAFDEFQRFMKVDPGALTAIQKLWDTEREGSGIFLIASGSSVGMIRRIFMERGSPLFKRADNIVRLRPFTMGDVFTVLDGIGVGDVKEKLNLHCLFGGTIYYYRMMEKYGVLSFADALDRLVLNDLAPLRTEVREILMEEFGKEHATYYEILTALAAGKCTKKEIGDVSSVLATSLSPYLYDLREILGAVDFSVPVNERPDRSKKGRYILNDNFFRFYFTFIHRNMSQYEVGAYDRIRDVILRDWGGHRGKAFELEARRFLRRALAEEYTDVGGFWDRRGNEVDVVGIDRKERRMLMVEVKCRDLGPGEARSVLDDLRAKSQLVPYGARHVGFGLLALSVGDREALEREGVRVWDLNDLLSGS